MVFSTRRLIFSVHSTTVSFTHTQSFFCVVFFFNLYCLIFNKYKVNLLFLGMKDGQKITFHGEGDQEPGLEPGDIIIVLDQKDHAVFTR